MKRMLLILAFALFIISLSSFASAEWRNMSDGFSIKTAGVSVPFDIATNGSDFWVADEVDRFIYHFNRNGVNMSDGFSTSRMTNPARRPFGIVYNNSDFWILSPDTAFVYHLDKNGNNMSDGFSVTPIGASSVYEFTGNGTDFWLADENDGWMYHVDRNGNNKSDGFKFTNFIGIADIYGMTTNSSDFWITDTDTYVYHVNKSGSSMPDGFSKAAFLMDSHGIVMNNTAGAYQSPREFWFVDFVDLFVYHIANTGPRISRLRPGESQPSGAVTITAKTDVDSTCRYSTQNLAYKDMTQQFSTTGTTFHSVSFTPTECITSIYVACRDSAGNENSNATGFSFSTMLQDCWSRFMNTLDVLGVTASNVPTTTPIEAWNFTTGGSVRSSPVIVNNILYIGATDGTFYAINANTGEEIWRRYFESSPHWPTIPITELDGTAAVEDGIVYITTGTNESLYALDAASGSYKWHHFNGDYSVSSPLIYGDKIFYTSRNYYLYALDKNTGSVLWAYNTGWRSQSSPSVYNGVVYAATRNGNLLHAVNESTGQKIWNFTEGWWNAYGSSTVSNGIIYLGSTSYNFYAINSTTGLEIWRYATGGGIATTASVYNGRVYISSYDNQLYAFDAVGGSKLWNYTIPATKNWLDSSPIISRGVVLIGGADRQFYAINATNGNKLWNYTVGANITSTPAVVNGYIYFGTNTPDNTTYALKLSAPNNPPIIQGISILPAIAYTDSALNCSAVYNDADSDSGSVSIIWYNGSVQYETTTKLNIANGQMISDELPDGIQAEGETWNCTINATDSQGNAGSLVSTTRTISPAPIAGYTPRWRHVAVTYSSTTHQKKIYVDGSLVRTETLSGLGNYKINSPAGNLYISKLNGIGGIQFNGTVDEVGVYSRAMSDNEIASGLMASTLYAAMPIQNEEKTFVINAENVTEVTVSPVIRIGNKEKDCGVTAKIRIPLCA